LWQAKPLVLASLLVLGLDDLEREDAGDGGSPERRPAEAGIGRWGGDDPAPSRAPRRMHGGDLPARWGDEAWEEEKGGWRPRRWSGAGQNGIGGRRTGGDW
jgi:hypothetical protein